ncbi:hypothetical protein BDV93DRAFT_514938 [Ceratobasidium sp. AG-I]|nr:hypothetical protein BDV93DRAFT_514938 [Ceratobasidium sp. AG-I]
MTHPASLARGAPARAGGGRAKIKSKKVQECKRNLIYVLNVLTLWLDIAVELHDEENAKIAHEIAQQRAETRYQNEVHDPSHEEIRAHNAQALQKEPGPGFYEVPVPSFQRVVNTRALQNEMIASQMRAAHIQAFIVRLMTSRNTNARKPFVKEMQKRVVPYYSFSARTDEATMQMNRLNCEALLNDGRFLVANHTLQELVGPYMCPLFFNVIKACCFTSKNAIGTRAAGGWSSISLSFLAFVATVAQHCVSEWVSGECVESPFSAEKYEGKFLAHHETLKQQRAEASASMDLYCKSLVECASRDHAKSTGSGGNASASVPGHIVRDWAVCYDVTSRNLACDSTFTGGLAFRVEQPQSSNITLANRPSTLENHNKNQQTAPEVPQPPFGNSFRGWQNININQAETDSERISQASRVPQPIGQATIRILSSKATHPEPSYAHGLAPFACTSPVSGVFAPAPHSAAPAVAYSNLQMDLEDSRLAPAQLSQSGRQVPSHPNTENTLVLPSSNNAVGGWN